MTNNFDEYFIESDYEEIYYDWYEIEGERKIKELSRQLRTFFNYKKEVIRYRFRAESNFNTLELTTNFLTQKQKFESLSNEFITLIKNFKNQGQSLDEMIRFLYYENNASQINVLSTIMEKLFSFIHNFSEENIHNHPEFLRFIIILAQNICLIKKCLYSQFSEFYEELEINYRELEVELDGLLEKRSNVKFKKPIKRLEEKLHS
ncbi:MAG: hypothetical protein EU542_04805 [Promethearchaeota archaeon]|nr:MAG: hypothetical protein EU542_04805 [Candidatus Lokiarchaeota archaeon]